jgi:hypothetical protein
MELELIEPSMYLRMHPDAPQRFAVAFDRYVASEAPGPQIQTQPKRPAFAEREDL